MEAPENPEAAQDSNPNQGAVKLLESSVRRVRYLCQIENGQGTSYAWNAARRNPGAGLLLASPERAILGQLSVWTRGFDLAQCMSWGIGSTHIEEILQRFRVAELIVTSEDTTADCFRERFVVVGASLTNQYATVETDAILRGADKIATIHPFDRPDSPFMALWRHKMVWVGSPFIRQSDQTEVLSAIADEYIALALRERHAVYLTFGHPYVGEAIPAYIQKKVWDRFRETVRIVPAISSLDTIFAQIPIDPFSDGPLVVIRPRDLALNLDPRISTLLVLVGYEKCGIFSRMQQDETNLIMEELAWIRDNALKCFPPDHHVYLLTGDYDRIRDVKTLSVDSRGFPTGGMGNVILPLERLTEFAKCWHSGASSLFIPHLPDSV